MLLSAGPKDKDPIVVIQVCYFGQQNQRSKGKELVDLIRSWDGGVCVLDDVAERDYDELGKSVEKLIGGVRKSLFSLSYGGAGGTG